MSILTQPTTAAGKYAMRWWVLAVMSLGTFMIFLDNTVVNTALPSIARDLEASTAQLQWVIDGYTLILAGLLLFGGTLGDRFGRRRAFLSGMIVFAGASVGAAISTNTEALIVMRALQGAGAALVLPATLSIITDVFPRSERSKAIGIWAGIGALGIVMGPTLGGVLVDEFNWAAVFWLHVPVVAVALVGLTPVPESRDSRLLGLDLPGALLATGGLLATVYALIQGNEAGWGSAEIVGAFALGLALLAAFAVVESRSRAPMLPMQFFRQKDFSAAVVIIGLVFFALLVTFFFLTQYFQLVLGKSATTAGLYGLPTGLMMMVGAPISGILVKRVGPRWMLVAAGLVVMAGLIWLAQVDVDSGYLSILPGLLTFGFGGGLGLAPLTDTVMAAVPVDDAGIGSAVNDVSRELGGTLGIAITGSIVSSTYASNVADALGGQAPAELVHQVGDGIGVAGLIAQTLPADLAATVMAAANAAFVDAFTTGLLISAGFMGLAAVVAFFGLPNQIRDQQAEDTRQPVAEPATRPVYDYPAPLPARAGLGPRGTQLSDPPHLQACPRISRHALCLRACLVRLRKPRAPAGRYATNPGRRAMHPAPWR